MTLLATFALFCVSGTEAATALAGRQGIAHPREIGGHNYVLRRRPYTLYGHDSHIGHKGFDMASNNKTPLSPPLGGTWTLAGAKARLSEVVDRAQAGPQTITRNGKPSAVIVSAEEWARKTVRKGTLAEFLLASPLRGADLDLERQRDAPRDVRL